MRGALSSAPHPVDYVKEDFHHSRRENGGENVMVTRAPTGRRG